MPKAPTYAMPTVRNLPGFSTAAVPGSYSRSTGTLTAPGGPSGAQGALINGGRYTPTLSRPMGPYSHPVGPCRSPDSRYEAGSRQPRYWDPNAAILAEIEAENRLFWPERYNRRRVAVYDSAQAAGWRETQWGAIGRNVPWEDQVVSRRAVIAHEESGGRLMGLSDRWDIDSSNFQMSGRLTRGTLARSSQMIPCNRPILRLTSRGGEVRLTVEAGSSMGGAQDSREFVLGNGFIATHDLSSWDNVTIRILETQALAQLEFSWISGQSASGDQTLFLPQRFDATGVARDVPNGAFRVAAQDAAATFTWINNVVEGFGTVTFDTALVAGGVVDVLGAQWITATANRFLWFVRPL